MRSRPTGAKPDARSSAAHGRPFVLRSLLADDPCATRPTTCLPHLLVPQFTRCGNVRRGNRPDFAAAMPPEQAKGLWQEFVERCGPAQCGSFAVDMRL